MSEAPVYAVNTSLSTSDQSTIQQNGDDPMRSKNFSKSFSLSSADKISLHNQYGGMVIKIWDKKEIKIDVSIRAFSNDDREAEKLIDQVNIAAEKNGDMVTCKTIIGERNRWSGRNRRREVKVNYVVYMPAVNSLTLTQEFGNVSMEDFAGPLYAKVQYGDFNAGKLTNTNNYVSVQYGKTVITEINKAVVRQQYGSGLTIATAGTLDLNAQYATVTINTIRGDAVIRQQYGSGISITNVGNLDLDAQYANVRIDNIKGNAVIKQQYNSVKIGTVGKLDLRAQYANVNIGNLRGDGNFKMSYNSFDVVEVGAGCRNLTIDADYVDSKLNFSDAFHGDFTVQTSYSGFRSGERVSVRQGASQDDDNSKTYTGKIGNGGKSNVRINADYGSVTFK
ncbi:hypothetical protein TH53_11335 [Pedobacter lusitanus]|uniref:Adhesin domain-containing protein n=1 Tax=Pedobacter lusitanus TaxID=1503925 RepID=A0A0D0GIJ4_9SPHI|nr:hypothetical protein TH53_11335 [Pedobacter lusitanus]